MYVLCTLSKHTSLLKVNFKIDTDFSPIGYFPYMRKALIGLLFQNIPLSVYHSLTNILLGTLLLMVP